MASDQVRKILFLEKKGFCRIEKEGWILETKSYKHFAHVYDNGTVFIYGLLNTGKEAYNTGQIFSISNDEFETIVSVLVDNNQ